MIVPTKKKLLALSRQLTILDQATGALVPWVLNEEQLEILDALLKSKRVIIGKAPGESTRTRRTRMMPKPIGFFFEC